MDGGRWECVNTGTFNYATMIQFYLAKEEVMIHCGGTPWIHNEKKVDKKNVYRLREVVRSRINKETPTVLCPTDFTMLLYCHSLKPIKHPAFEQMILTDGKA